MSALNGKLEETPLSSHIRQNIIQHLWPASNNGKTMEYDLGWEPYFDYYEIQCHHALHEQGKNILVRTHQDIVDIAIKLRQGLSRATIKEDLRKFFTAKKNLPNEEVVLDNSIDLVARLCLMVNVGTYDSAIIRGEQLLWDSSSIKIALLEYFSEPQQLSDSKIRFEKAFTAANIERIADMKICWTNNLADHLRMVDDDDRTIAIFPHALFLECQKDNILFPQGLIDETLRSLALLFTTHNKKQTERWLHTVDLSPQVCQYLMRCKKVRLDDRQIETFRFWHDRLVILKQAFDESSPSKMKQWWYDRRNSSLWYTFWVAVFVSFSTVFFGLVQSVEGGLQVYKAYHSTTR